MLNSYVHTKTETYTHSALVGFIKPLVRLFIFPFQFSWLWDEGSEVQNAHLLSCFRICYHIILLGHQWCSYSHRTFVSRIKKSGFIVLSILPVIVVDVSGTKCWNDWWKRTEWWWKTMWERNMIDRCRKLIQRWHFIYLHILCGRFSLSINQTLHILLLFFIQCLVCVSSWSASLSRNASFPRFFNEAEFLHLNVGSPPHYSVSKLHTAPTCCRAPGGSC